MTTDNADEPERDEGGFEFGQTIKGSISLEKISARYEIDAKTNDVLSIRMRTTAGELQPSFTLFAPDGSEVCNDYSSSSAYDTCEITLSGTHNLLVQDNDSGSLNTGSYELHVQRTSDPLNATALALRDSVTGQITDAQMVSTYQFEAGAEAVLLVEMVMLREDLNPRIEIYGPDGFLLCEESENSVRAMLVCPTAAAGQHTLLVMESHYGDGRNFGDYALLVQDIGSPTDSADDSGFEFGQTINGSISLEKISTLYNINAETNDVLSIRMRTTNGEFQPSFTLYAPDGSEVCADYITSSVADDICDITLSGTHSLLVRGADRDILNIGSYELHVQRTSEPVNATALTIGEYVAGQITDTQMVASYQFEADAAEALFVQIGVQNDELNPQIEIYGPDGSLLCEESEHRVRATLVCPAVTAGQHTLLVMGSPYAEDSNTGDYTLLIQSINSPTDVRPVPMGATVTGKLDTGLSAHFYQMELLAGGALYAQMSVTDDAADPNGESLDPGIELYSQDGELICDESYAGLGTELVCEIEADGPYTMIIRDTLYSSLDGGSYSLYVQDRISPVNASRLDGGKPYTDVLSPEELAKSYTLTGRQNDVLTLRMTQKDSEVKPNILLFNPNGVVLCSDQTASATLELVCTLDEDGEYLVIVSDNTQVRYNDGEFGLFLQNLNDVKNAKPLATGDSTTSVIGDIAEQQTYVLDGNAGSVFAITLFVVSGDFDPNLRLFDPTTGEVVCDFRVYGSSDTEQCTLVNDGQHVVMVSSGTSSQLDAGEFGLAITQVSAE